MAQMIGPLLCRAVHLRQEAVERQRAAVLHARNAQREDALGKGTLKALHCKRCGSEWIVRETDLDEQHRCPSCGFVLRGHVKLTKFDSLGAALCGAAAEHGVEILRDLDAVSEIMHTLAPGLKKEIRIFTRTLTPAYAEQIIAVLMGDPRPLETLREQFIGEEGLSAAWADMLCAAFGEAARLMSMLGQEQLMNASVADFAVPAAPARSQRAAKSQPAEKPAEKSAAPAQSAQKQTKSAPDVPQGMTIENGVLKSYTGTDAEVRVPDGVREIGSRAFSMCTSLTAVELPDSVRRIGNKAFYACVSLERIKLPEGLREIGNSTFFNCGSLRGVTLPATLVSIGSSAFSWCASLEELTLPKGLTEIREMTFANCAALRAVKFPEGLLTIRSAAFSNCTGLTKLVLPKSLKSVESCVFERCLNLVEITVPTTAELNPSMFKDVSPRVKYHANQGAVPAPEEAEALPEKTLTYSAGKQAAAHFRADTKSFAVPKGFTHITRWGLQPYAREMKALILPATVRQIDSDTFADCESLQRISVSAENPCFKVQLGKLIEIDSGDVIWMK